MQDSTKHCNYDHDCDNHFYWGKYQPHIVHRNNHSGYSCQKTMHDDLSCQYCQEDRTQIPQCSKDDCCQHDMEQGFY